MGFNTPVDGQPWTSHSADDASAFVDEWNKQEAVIDESELSDDLQDKVNSESLLSTLLDLGNVSGLVQLDLSLASAFKATVTGSTVFSFVNWPSGTLAIDPIVEVHQDATGGRSISFSGVTWLPSGSPPSFLTGANQVSIVPFFSANNGSTIYGQGGSATGGGFGVYGDGSDGAITLDGTSNPYSSFLGWSGSFYWCLRDIFPASLNVGAGISLQSGTSGASYRIVCSGPVTIGTGAFITTTTGSGVGTLPAGAQGPTGTTGAGSAGSNTTGVGFGGSGGASGGGNAGGAGGTASLGTNISTPHSLIPAFRFSCLVNGTETFLSGGSSGGSGGGDGTNAGGNGGHGSPALYLAALSVTNNGEIRTRGGNGGNAAGGNAGGGGAGGAGPLVLIYGTYSGSGLVRTLGGNAGTKAGTGVNGGTAGTSWVLQLVN